MTNKRKSRILDEMHESAIDLFESGVITKRRMAEYEVLCNLNVPPMTSTQIKKLRHKFNVSQAVLAKILNTSLSTVQKWEVGDKKPSGPSLKLLSIIQKKGLEIAL